MPNKQVEELTLTIDGLNIEIFNLFNILRLTLISHLKWIKHIDKIANRCSQTIGLITKLEHIIQTRIQIALYNSITLPHTNYYILIYGHKCNVINKLQKTLIRISNKYSSHIEFMFK